MCGMGSLATVEGGCDAVNGTIVRRRTPPRRDQASRRAPALASTGNTRGTRPVRAG